MAHTSTAPELEHPALTLAERAPITSLRFLGRRLPPLPLPAAKKLFTIGAGACDLIIARKISDRVSGFHATLARTGPALIVTDQESKNGTYRSRGEGRLKTFQVYAGEPIWLGTLSLLASDEQLDVLRPRLAECLGLDRDAEIDRALMIVASPLRPALALVGPVGSGALRLAEAIHRASPQRDNFFLSLGAGPLPSLEHAVGGTVFLDLDAIKKLPAPYVKTLLDPARSMRAIFSATTEQVIRAQLDHFKHVEVVSLVPLAERRREVLPLVASHWIEVLRTARRVEDLPWVHRIAEHDWPRNLDELYEASRRLHLYLVHGGLRPAATVLGITHQSLSKYLRRIHFAPQDRIREP